MSGLPPERPRAYHPYGRSGRGHGAAASQTIGSVEVQKRIKRALEERLFVVDNLDVSSSCRQFAIMGSTGNVYTVQIGSDVRCTCPDFARGFHNCKHLLYVLIRVLRVSRTDPRLVAKRFPAAEVARLLSEAPHVHPSCLADARVRSAYEQIKGGATEQQVQDDASGAPKVAATHAASAGAAPLSLSGRPRTPLDDAEELCAICFDDLTSHDDTVWCRRQCGKNVHTLCMEVWIKHKQRERVEPSCPNCRAAPWIHGASPPSDASSGPAMLAAASAPAAAAATSNEGYINLLFACTPRTHTL